LDLIFKADFVHDDDPMPESLLKVSGCDEYLSFVDLPSRAKAEALIVILLSSCLNLASSPYKNVIQDVFGRLVFHSRSGLCRFVVNRNGNLSDLSHEAASYLHGRALSSLMGVPEEAFVRFVIITDLLRYHFHAIGDFSKKYRHLLGDDDYKKIVLLTKDYTGAKALSKPEKGWRNHDIRFFLDMKSTVSVERHGMVIEPSNELHKMLENQFFFNYQGSSVKVKEELKQFRKRKAFTLSNSTYPEAIAMPLDDGDFVDYRQAAIGKRAGV
jgi:hypothetical protein